jgi:hypothetical protein
MGHTFKVHYGYICFKIFEYEYEKYKEFIDIIKEICNTSQWKFNPNDYDWIAIEMKECYGYEHTDEITSLQEIINIANKHKIELGTNRAMLFIPEEYSQIHDVSIKCDVGKYRIKEGTIELDSGVDTSDIDSEDLEPLTDSSDDDSDGVAARIREMNRRHA